MTETLIHIAGAAGLVLFFLVMAASIISVIFGLPGTWIILLEAAIYSAILKFEGPLTVWVLALLLGLALLGELFEFILTAYGAKKYGEASKLAIAGAILGGMIGAVLLAGTPPVIGAILGAFIGVFLGASLVTYAREKNWDKAFQAGRGAFVGRLGAVMAKGTIAVSMAGVIVARLFF